MIPDDAARLAARQPNGRRPQVMHHRWESLLFLHWALPTERVQATLPAGLTVDTFEARAYLGIVPFFMRNVRPVGFPGLPGLSNFQELNVRTYVYDQSGTPGVWFYSLDCNQPLAVAGARLLTGLPYFQAEMTSTETGESIGYTCRRKDTQPVAHFVYGGVGAARATHSASLDFFLLERYYLFATRGRSLVRAQV